MVNMIVHYSETEHLPHMVDMMEALNTAGLYSPKLSHGETLKEWMRKPDNTYVRYVLTVGRKAVGHVAARNQYPQGGLVDIFLNTLTVPEGETIHEIRRLFLHPRFHGKGYGNLLLKTGEREIMKHNGLPFLTVKATSPAVQFYEKHGWGVVKTLQDRFDSNLYWNAMFKNPEYIIHYNPHLTVAGT